ncbi:unnamed protein product [Symbiodinium sp. KB8]|nr:unnamed protein product [Symbiodinium sp. KB8]
MIPAILCRRGSWTLRMQAAEKVRLEGTTIWKAKLSAGGTRPKLRSGRVRFKARRVPAETLVNVEVEALVEQEGRREVEEQPRRARKRQHADDEIAWPRILLGTLPTTGKAGAGLLFLVKHTLWEGQNVLAHCMAGRHWGASAGAVLLSIMSGDSLEGSERKIQERRDIELWQIRNENKDLAEWMLRVVRVTKLGAAPPLPVAYVATQTSLLHLETAGRVTLCQHRHAKGARKLSAPMRTSDKFEAFAWLKESCAQCFSMATRERQVFRLSFGLSEVYSRLFEQSWDPVGEESLDTLALNFSPAPEIQTRLLAEGLNHLEELRFFFDNEVALTDLDTMLEVHPADSLLSRVSRELSKRMLCVFAFWKVCSLYFQLTTVQRKRKLGDNLYTEEIETEGSISKDVETYLDKLYTLLLAYAMAGVHPLPGVDLSKAKDIEERSEWVTRFREGGLGEAQATGGTGATATQAALQVSHFREGSKVGGKRVAAVLKVVARLGMAVKRSSEGPVDVLLNAAQSCPGLPAVRRSGLDCSTKSAIREIPLKFESGRPTPRPLRSHEHPMGLPGLNISDQRPVSKDSCACKFVLDEQQKILERGGGAIRENPSNSLHWCIPQEAEMWVSGQWWDARYEEAEYTAPFAFHVAVACSWWACRLGFAKLHVPRGPPVQCMGRREHWLDIDPRALREWAMSPLAITLGLRPIDPSEAARVPQRVEVAAVLRQDKTLPPGVVYVGRGHNCGADEWLSLYVERIVANLQTVCECDLLAGLVFDGGVPKGTPHPPAAGRLQHLESSVLRWCDEMGACSVQEVVDCLEYLIAALDLQKSDAKRLCSEASRALKKLKTPGALGLRKEQKVPSTPPMTLAQELPGLKPFTRTRQGLKKKMMKDRQRQLASTMSEGSITDGLQRKPTTDDFSSVEAAKEKLALQLKEEEEKQKNAAITALNAALSKKCLDDLGVAIQMMEAVGLDSHELVATAKRDQEMLSRRHLQLCEESVCALQAALEAPRDDRFGQAIREALQNASFACQV